GRESRRPGDADAAHLRVAATRHRSGGWNDRTAGGAAASARRQRGRHHETRLMAVESVPCALCGGTFTRPYLAKLGLKLVKCLRCGLVYCNPRLSAEDNAVRYNPDYFHNEYLPSVSPPPGVDLGTFVDDRFRPTIALLEKSGTTRGRLLEIGTGAGFFLKAAARAGWDAYGL